MKVLIDTCVVMDFLQQREPFANDAKTIFRAVASEQFTGYITAKSATDIYYCPGFKSIRIYKTINRQILLI